MSFIYHPEYNLDLGPHVFPARKYYYIYDKIKKNKKLNKIPTFMPSCAERKELELVHTKEYLDDFFNLRITERTQFSELPLNTLIQKSFLLATGGTILAIKKLINEDKVFNLGGGFHHAMPNWAEGFCYLNDSAIAAMIYLSMYKEKKVLFIDLDLHQGNANAFFFKNHPQVFTFSMHQENIYPKKETSSLDVPLLENCKDDEYLSKLEKNLIIIESKFQADLIFYIAGADPYEDDSLGELKLTMDGLKKRDEMVRKFHEKLKTKIVILPAGGYARNFDDTVKIHLNTVETFFT